MLGSMIKPWKHQTSLKVFLIQMKGRDYSLKFLGNSHQWPKIQNGGRKPTRIYKIAYCCKLKYYKLSLLRKNRGISKLIGDSLLGRPPKIWWESPNCPKYRILPKSLSVIDYCQYEVKRTTVVFLPIRLFWKQLMVTSFEQHHKILVISCKSSKFKIAVKNLHPYFSYLTV